VEDAYSHRCSCHVNVHAEHSKTGEVGAIALHHCVVPILGQLDCSHSLCRPTTTANPFEKEEITNLFILYACLNRSKCPLTLMTNQAFKCNEPVMYVSFVQVYPVHLHSIIIMVVEH